MHRKAVLVGLAAIGIGAMVLASTAKGKGPPPPPPHFQPPPAGPCPATITGYLPDLSTPVTADLVDMGTAQKLLGVANTVGAVAVYQIRGGVKEGEFVYPAFGGNPNNTWGQLQGFHYCQDGTCVSTGGCSAPPPYLLYVIAAKTPSGLCDITVYGTKDSVCAQALSMVGLYEDSFPGGCYHEIVQSVQVWLGPNRVC